MTLALMLAFLTPSVSAAPFLPSSTLRFDATPQALREHCRSAKKRAESELEALARLPASARTFDNTPWALDRIVSDLTDETSSDVFLKQVSTSSSVREASGECETLIGQFPIETYAREDLYRALKEYVAGGKVPSGEAKRLVEKELLDFKRSGLELTKPRRKEALDLRKRIVELESAFTRNLNEYADFALFSRDELKGMSEDFIGRLEQVDGKYKVRLEAPDYYPFMENASSPEARRALEKKFGSRAALRNVPVLSELLTLRRKAANLLGYPTHAHYVLEERMARDPKTVAKFISRLREKLTPVGAGELEVLQALKLVYEGRGSDKRINAWDWRYYDSQLKKSRYSVDVEKIREYFPVDLVVERTLGVYQTLLGLKFRRIDDAALWHPVATLYEFSAAAGGGPIAYFYMDLFAREGKYQHFSAVPLIMGRRLSDGSYQKPVSVIIANFTRPAPGRPSLLAHKEVETFFHEFGHSMHQSLTKARFGRFSGSRTSLDFVEAPSQMLENWVWDAEVLKSLSGHFRDHANKLPKEHLDRLLAAKTVDAGLFSLRQLFFAALDQDYHAIPPEDTTRVYARFMRDVSLIPMSEDTHPEAGFDHLAIGYDAGVYGYLWSKVYAQDMYSRFKDEGVLNPVLGRRYRTEILEKGSSRDEMDSLKAFLGREPDERAFLESLGARQEK